MNEDRFLSLTETFKLLNVAIATSKLQELKTPYASIRPSMHSILVGDIGNLKSTILKDICSHFKAYPTFNITSAVLLGSVDKNSGIPIFPLIWECRESILPIDELNIDSQNNNQRQALSILLSVLENPEFKKKIAYRVNNYSKSSNGLYCKIKDGTIHVKTRFVLVANTMQRLFRPQRSIEMEALKSRCILIPYYPTIEELKDMLKGAKLYVFNDLPYSKICQINEENYLKIMDFMDKFEVQQSYYARTLGDLCRAFAVVGFDENIFNLIIKCRTFTTRR